MLPRVYMYLRRRYRCGHLLIALGLYITLNLLYRHANWTSRVPHPRTIHKRAESSVKESTPEQLRKQFGYNAWLVEQLPPSPLVKHVRHKLCERSEESGDSGSEGVSIVVIFRNEQMAMLLRTLHSIVAATPSTLLSELLVIDDNSDIDYWDQQHPRDAFDEYLKTNFFGAARFLHLKESVGVVRARRVAVTQITTDTVVFVDVHVEVSAGWLPPLLEAIGGDNRTLATPLLDVLDPETIKYNQVDEPKRGLFDWTLKRREVPLLAVQRRNLPRPYETPVMHAAVFAINAKAFDTLSNFDPGVIAPAAAELELSLQFWCMGGRVLVVPCSRVAHLQPSDARALQRYGDLNQMGMQLFRSYKRLAEVWLRDSPYKEKVYAVQQQIEEANVGSLEKLYVRFEEFGFNTFDWYLQHVATDFLQHFPFKSLGDQLSLGSFRPAQRPSHCLTGNRVTYSLSVLTCELDIYQQWYRTPMGDIRIDGQYCLEMHPEGGKVSINLCHTLGGYQSWHYDISSTQLVSNNYCLEYDQLELKMGRCSLTNTKQKWTFLDVLKDGIWNSILNETLLTLNH